MDIAELLIENGAKTKVRDIDGQTPLDLAQSSGKFTKKMEGEQNSKPFSFFFENTDNVGAVEVVDLLKKAANPKKVYAH